MTGWTIARAYFRKRLKPNSGPLPRIEVVDQWGEEHRKTFSVAVYIGEEMAGLGTGKNKREAAQNAAREALGKLQ